MRSRYLGVLPFVWLALAATPWAAGSDLIDLHELGFEVVSAKAVPQINLSGGLYVKPKPGYQLVVVELKGALKRPARYVITPEEFAVVYEEERPAKPNWPAWKDAIVVGAQHVEGGNGQWVASYVTSAAQAVEVNVKFAVTLPQEVKRFTVLYGCFAKPTVEVMAAPEK
jgi:hypothetical protein